MTQTAEQRAADEALTEAIRTCLRVQGYDATGVVVDHMTIVCTTNFDGENAVSSILFLGSEIPHYRMLGMLDFVSTGLRAEIAGRGQCPET